MEYVPYTCKTGDRIDKIVYSHYGSIENLNLVLEHNSILCEKSLILESGLVLFLPVVVEVTTVDTVVTQRKSLW